MEATRKHIFEEFNDAERQFQMICGTPKSVLPKIKTLLEVLRPEIFMIWQIDGRSRARIASTTCGCSARKCCPRFARWARSST